MRPARTLPPSVAAAYDHAAAGYDATYADPMHTAEDRLLRRWLRRRVPPGFVVDLGCGTGWLIDQLDAPAGQYLGLDISPGMLAVARAKHPAHRFVEADMTAVGHAAAVAAVVATWSLNYHPHPARVLAAAAAALLPGGRLLAITYGPGFGDGAACFTADGARPPMRRFTPTALRMLAGGAGLEVLELGGFRRPHPPLWPGAPGWAQRCWLPVEQATVRPDRAAYLLLAARRPHARR
jgi:predicted TPR repeat methyltransferase